MKAKASTGDLICVQTYDVRPLVSRPWMYQLSEPRRFHGVTDLTRPSCHEHAPPGTQGGFHVINLEAEPLTSTCGNKLRPGGRPEDYVAVLDREVDRKDYHATVVRDPGAPANVE
jgi:hypothetical protein